MSAERVDGFDVAVSEAWQRFECNLAAHIASMPVGTYVTISSAQASHGQRGQRPYVDVVTVEADRIVGVAALPSYLYPNGQDSSDADSRLHGLGWSEPGKPTVDGTVMDFTVDGPLEDAGLLATMAVATFREVWNVPHPSFLTAWGVGLGENANGPVALHHEPTSDRTPRSDGPLDALPTALRSLHAFCELMGARVDPDTVLSVCVDEDLAELVRRALDAASACDSRARELSLGGATGASRVWAQQRQSWTHTADSLRAVDGSSPSGQDRPAKSTGS